MREYVKAQQWVIANQHGDVVAGSNATTRFRAWQNVRQRYGAYETLQLRRRHYAAVRCSITYDKRSELSWQKQPAKE